MEFLMRKHQKLVIDSFWLEIGIKKPEELQNYELE